MSCRGCLTHPALCEGRKCPDWERRGYIGLKPSYIHGKRSGMDNGDSSSECRGASKVETKEGRERHDLGRVCSQYCRNRRRISKNDLQTAHYGKQAQGNAI